MKYRKLRGTGLFVSPVSLGTMNIQSMPSDNDAIRLIHHALDSGINIIDTAEVYCSSEELIGRALTPNKRDAVILVSKVFGRPSNHDLNSCGLNRKHICKALDLSLSRLRTDYLDILYLHGMDESAPIDEALTTMDSFVRAGKIRYYGISNFTAWQTVEILWKCDQMGLIKPALSQNIYNLLTRDIESELIPCLIHFGIGLQAYNVLAGGFLTGKYSNGIPEDSRYFSNPSYVERYWNHANRNAVRLLSDLAFSSGISLTELSLRWCLGNDAVSSAVIGVSSCQQLTDIVKIAELPCLPKSLVESCNTIWQQLAGRRQFYGRYFKRI